MRPSASQEAYEMVLERMEPKTVTLGYYKDLYSDWII